MNIDHIKAFLEVMSSGSFQVAAKRLNLNQSTISARIITLEEKLNRKLFNRKRNGVELTTGGKLFHRHAINTVQSWERAQLEMALPKSLKAVVSFGIQLNHWDMIAEYWLNWMQQNAPDIATVVLSENSATLMDQLQNGVLDLAIVYDPKQSPNLVIEPFTVNKLVLVSTQKIIFKENSIDGYVFVDWGETFKMEHSKKIPQALPTKLSVGIGDIGLRYILKNGGAGYFLEEMVQPYLENDQLHLVKQAPVFFRPTYLVFQELPLDQNILKTAIKGLKVVAGKKV